jgi:hypothetical protein
MTKRIKTNYPGVYYREAARTGRKGLERVYYIVFKKDGKTIEKKAGRQYADDMTPPRNPQAAEGEKKHLYHRSAVGTVQNNPPGQQSIVH